MEELENGYLQNPHDKFFKEIFSEKEEATEFIRQILPKELINQLDIDSLTLDNTSYVDDTLEECFSDLVYNCNFKGKIKLKITLLFEHKSYQASASPIHFQLMKYMIKIWEQRLSQKEPLTPIIPVVIYHGKNKWKKQSIIDYFSENTKVEIPNELKQFLPSFEYILIDLGTYSDEEIRKNFSLVSLQTSLLLMKKIFEKKLENELYSIFLSFKELLKTDKGKRIFQTLLLYLYYATKIEMNKIMETMNNISLEAQQETLTLAQRLILKGKVEGKAEGKAETQFELISNMLRKRLKPTEIADFTGIDLKTINEIAKKIKKK